MVEQHVPIIETAKYCDTIYFQVNTFLRFLFSNSNQMQYFLLESTAHIKPILTFSNDVIHSEKVTNHFAYEPRIHMFEFVIV